MEKQSEQSDSNSYQNRATPLAVRVGTAFIIAAIYLGAGAYIRDTMQKVSAKNQAKETIREKIKKNPKQEQFSVDVIQHTGWPSNKTQNLGTEQAHYDYLNERYDLEFCQKGKAPSRNGLCGSKGEDLTYQL